MFFKKSSLLITQSYAANSERKSDYGIKDRPAGLVLNFTVKLVRLSTPHSLPGSPRVPYGGMVEVDRRTSSTGSPAILDPVTLLPPGMNPGFNNNNNNNNNNPAR